LRAIVQDHYGSAEDVLRLEEIDRPGAGDGQVLLRVQAAGVDRGVWHLTAGLPYPVRFAGYGVRAPKTRVRGLDVAGRVEALGAGVTRFAVGDEVFGIADGSFAEYACAEEAKLARKPRNLTFEQAAAVPVSALAALQAVRDHGHVHAGQTVLIIGASGGWARSRCRSPRRSVPRSPACAAPPRSTSCVPSVPITSSTTRHTTSPTTRTDTT
jgi:NADPH:quinone reductase-like Zn-dependent oxidoreductase